MENCIHLSLTCIFSIPRCWDVPILIQVQLFGFWFNVLDLSYGNAKKLGAQGRQEGACDDSGFELSSQG